MRRSAWGFIWVALAFSASAGESVPRYEHIFVIVEENHTADQIIGSGRAPTLDALAKAYGLASNFYGETHPSEPNYVAMLGGDTFGISDDDAYYCKPGSEEDGCSSADSEGYVHHTITAPNLTDQLAAKGLSWKGYFENLPAPGSGVFRYPSSSEPVRGLPHSLYAAKHNGFMNFKSVQDDPLRARKIVAFDQLAADIERGTLPHFAMIVPNQCNDMHGLVGRNVPWDCFYLNRGGLIRRADAQVADIVGRIIASPVWRAPENAAIVITFDENDSGSSGDHPESCCGSPHNPGGGWITTIVVTNHGPRGVVDPTAYNHYSLLRTIEMAFGIRTYLGHAADRDKGVVAMVPLFAAGKEAGTKRGKHFAPTIDRGTMLHEQHFDRASQQAD